MVVTLESQHARRPDVKIRAATLTIALSAICALTAGCATGRRTIDLNVPSSAVAVAEKGKIAITRVTDERHFENKPAQASTPSIDGDVNAASRDTLKTLIGRQRGGFGAALGDVALTPPATVETEAQALVAEGLKRRGYRVGASPGEDSVEVLVKEFWAWFRPGFAEIAFEADIRTVLTFTVAGQQRTLEVKGHGREEGQMASNEHWQRAYDLAYEDFLKNLDASLAGAGL